MKSGASGLTAALSYQATICRHFQTIALDQALNAALLDVPLYLGPVVMVVTEGLVDLGRGQMRQAFKDLFHAQPQFIVAYNGFDWRPGVFDNRSAAADPRHLSDIAVLPD